MARANDHFATVCALAFDAFNTFAVACPVPLSRQIYAVIRGSDRIAIIRTLCTECLVTAFGLALLLNGNEAIAWKAIN